MKKASLVNVLGIAIVTAVTTPLWAADNDSSPAGQVNMNQVKEQQRVQVKKQSQEQKLNQHQYREMHQRENSHKWKTGGGAGNAAGKSAGGGKR